MRVTEEIREWDYGEYEGVRSPDIREMRRNKGLSPDWNIWKDGCPGGENPKSKEEGASGDVLIVAHGHILRALAMRWTGKLLSKGPTFLLEAGGVGTLSYEHHNIEQPAILLGGSFVSGRDIQPQTSWRSANSASSGNKTTTLPYLLFA
ncbi:hypothetical protein P8C59_009585 [Phyllachora maydis]|uniref:Phosphoglycerate mutase n=1 Tax=Phyllachora maydis TaxID=1825666 RepID=A0AAD9IE84_9PEZI|nr:hypothetical protein P8C59_009585 [Phyllachora maydis]